MLSMSSTLVETVSIDYEDFNESFLTCGTCLCKFYSNILLEGLFRNDVTQLTGEGLGEAFVGKMVFLALLGGGRSILGQNGIM